MSTRTSYAPGTPCWVDLTTPDVAASADFYTGLFGWSATEEHDDDGNHVYTNLRRGDQLVAGLGPQPDELAGMPAAWNTYVATEDVDATAKRVEAAGGTVMMPPMDVMGEGRMAIFADPTGAVVSAWQPRRHFGAEVCNEPDAWSWNELLSRDLDTAMPFYAEVFGWTFDGQEMPFGTYHVIEGGDEGGLGGLMAMPPEVPEQVPNYWGVYFTVTDAEAAAARAAELGGSVVQEAMTLPGVGTMATVSDPAGGTFTLMQPETT